ncbi:MAG: bifunctional oligoribonuclease/PAP phosphatase NrnA [Chitinispirillaceae bacterium]|nr:bifunctional oligoribonuclease/PAP phosphatase NrnA [Chitinispirillaceae bacterium]
MIWRDFNSLINSYKRFLITSHISLDGDAVGCEIAIRWHLLQLGKEITIYNKDPVPAKFSFLEGSSSINNSKVPTGEFDVMIVLDCSNLERIGWKPERIPSVIINIDHHRDNSIFGTHNIIDKNAAATAELIYTLFTENNIKISKEVADALYTAILTDTGGFRFPNTTAKILRICSELVELGANPATVYEKVYASYSQSALLLQAKIWSTLKYYLNGKVCCMRMPMSLLNKIGAVYSDSEGMADLTIIGEGVEVGILIKYNETETHFSMRSKGKIDVGKIAQRIKGGGGHFSAAGCTLKMPYKRALSYMLKMLREEVGD